jgi:hypothetical protein
MFQKFFCLITGLFLFFSSTIIPGQLNAMPGKNAAAGGRSFTGLVLESMNAAGYTYMLLESSGKKTWVAIPETAVAVGTVVKYFEGMAMENFTSKTLNKTFDSIVFSSGLSDAAISTETSTGDDSFASAVKSESAAQPMAVTPQGSEMSGGSSGAIVPFAELSVEKSTAANGYSIGEIFKKSKDLSGKKVQVKGKVVKFSPMIMGKNWIHLQDGTGDPMHNSHDLVITTNDTVELNSIVTLEGVLSANKDFGAGYKYEAIVEQASILK